MAKKNKTKCSKQKRHRIRRKLLQAQQKNEFFARVHQLVKAAGALEAFYLMPKKKRDLLWYVHFKPLQVQAGSDHEYAKHFITYIRQYILKSVKLSSHNILPNGTSISLYDLSTIGQTLFYHLEYGEKEPFENFAEVKKGFANFLDFMKGDVNPRYQIMQIARYVAWRLTKIDERLYWFALQTEFCSKPSSNMYDCLYLNSQSAEKVILHHNDTDLIAYRVGWPHVENVTWLQIKASAVFYDGGEPDQLLNVFIQSDALQDLRHGLDLMTTDTLHFYLFESLDNGKSFLTKNGTVLFEYYLLGIKAGYLVAEVTGGNVLIRSFLFLTQSGTPEAEKLHELGLKMPDGRQLEIKRLSVFLKVFLNCDDRVKELLQKTDCAGLFNLNEDFAANSMRYIISQSNDLSFEFV